MVMVMGALRRVHEQREESISTRVAIIASSGPRLPVIERDGSQRSP